MRVPKVRLGKRLRVARVQHAQRLRVLGSGSSATSFHITTVKEYAKFVTSPRNPEARSGRTWMRGPPVRVRFQRPSFDDPRAGEQGVVRRREDQYPSSHR
ncbi:hypothetical protein OBBRIDRAFT_349987 [Obba rivulosa]|uniref:Uncharacterized protein n=1 Tax=Obba rivulosa TaxID=1052685 RepID=A0A8E2B6B6_9APHY|nr:hypothetical protein OBBRIDRAFT_349987 [Obba rivulosa]